MVDRASFSLNGGSVVGTTRGMAGSSSKQPLADQVDRVSDLLEKAMEGDTFAREDVRKELWKLRRALMLTDPRSRRTVVHYSIHPLHFARSN